MHRKDSDRLPGYFVLRSGCQIVQGAVLTPAPTLILGSSTARVGCAPPLFFATDHILQNCYDWDGGEVATVFVGFAFFGIFENTCSGSGH